MRASIVALTKATVRGVGSPAQHRNRGLVRGEQTTTEHERDRKRTRVSHDRSIGKRGSHRPLGPVYQVVNPCEKDGWNSALAATSNYSLKHVITKCLPPTAPILHMCP